MKPWHWVVVIIAAVGIVLLVVYGDGGRDVAGREREGFSERAAQDLVVLPVTLGPAPAIAVIQQQPNIPDDIKSELASIQQLVQTADTQPPDQAKATLGQAHDQMSALIKKVEKSADDASNDVTRLRLLQLEHTLKVANTLIEAKQQRL